MTKRDALVWIMCDSLRTHHSTLRLVGSRAGYAALEGGGDAIVGFIGPRAPHVSPIRGSPWTATERNRLPTCGVSISGPACPLRVPACYFRQRASLGGCSNRVHAAGISFEHFTILFMKNKNDDGKPTAYHLCCLPFPRGKKILRFSSGCGTCQTTTEDNRAYLNRSCAS